MNEMRKLMETLKTINELEAIKQTFYVVEGFTSHESDTVLGLYDSVETAKFALSIWYDEDNNIYDSFVITPIKINDKIKDFHPDRVQINPDQIIKQNEN